MPRSGRSWTLLLLTSTRLDDPTRGLPTLFVAISRIGTSLIVADWRTAMSDVPFSDPSSTGRLEREIEHLLEGAAEDANIAGMGTVRILAECKGNSRDVLSKAKAVLLEVDHAAIGHWPADREWRDVLPDWFVHRCAPELTQEEAEELQRRRRELSPEERARVEKDWTWSLLNWLYWFQPENRTWYWWDAMELSPDKIVVAIEVDEWPFPWGALSWLLRAAGAIDVHSEE